MSVQSFGLPAQLWFGGRRAVVYHRIADERVTVLLDMGAQVLQDHLDGVAACPVVRPVPSRENAVG